MIPITEIHEKIFNYLTTKLKLDSSLYFKVRQTDEYGRLGKGYWFYGTDKEVYLIFWDAWDKQTNSYNIIFSINIEGACTLKLQSKDKEEIAIFFEDILTSALHLEQVISKNQSKYWQKNYPTDKNYMDNLSDFLNNDKQEIDRLIKEYNKDTLIPFIKEQNFREGLKLLERWRQSANVFKDLDGLNKRVIKLKNIQLTNIAHFKTLNLNIDNKVTCLIGGNGSGKSTLLRAIALGITGIKPFKETKNLPDLLRIVKAIKGKEYADEGKIQLLYTIDNYDEDNLAGNAVLFRKPKSKNEIIIEDILDDPDSFLLNQEDELLKYLVVGFSQQTKNYVEKGLAEKSSLPNIDDLSALIFDEPDNRFQSFNNWINALINIHKPESRINLIKNKKLINDILTVISDITNDTIRLTDNLNEAFVTTKNNPEGIPLSLVSQGYRNVVGWVGFFMKRLYQYGIQILPSETDFKKLPAICLIDEIDTYLHPAWQYSILSGLVKHFPNTQFIITSHSPFVLTTVLPESITIYNIQTEGEIKIEEINTNLYGATVNRATTEMGSTERMKKNGIDFTHDIERLFTLIENNQLEEAKKLYDEKLSKIDAELDLDIIRAKRMMRSKELINKAKSAVSL